MTLSDQSDAHGELLLPALRGRMGDWVYYSALLSFNDVVARVSLADEIHVSRSLNELIQRALTNNAGRIAQYLLSQPQRMMSALVIAVYGGEPRWYQIDVKQNVHMEPQGIQQVEMKLGVLQLLGNEQLFAVDGQHRVVGVRDAVRQRHGLGDEEVAVIFVAHDPETDVGRQRTRRLFTTLNRYAKPVSLTEKIALDEDDVVAIVTRRLLDEHPVVFERVSTARTVSLAPTNKTAFTSLPALYASLDVILRDRAPRAWSDFKRLRPRDADLERYFKSAARFLDLLSEWFPPMARLKAASTEPVAAEFRTDTGGHLLFRPVGLIAVARAYDRLVRARWQPRASMRRLAYVPMALDQAPWAGLLWDTTLHRMITTKEAQTVAVGVLIYGAGGSERELGRSVGTLRLELAGLMQRNEADVALRAYSRPPSGHLHPQPAVERAPHR